MHYGCNAYPLPMPTTQLPRRSHRERSDAMRAQLIHAAIQVVRERTFHGASVFEVAKAAGVTPGAFQHHFGTKAELMMQVTRAILRGDLEGPVPWPATTLALGQRAQRVVRLLWERIYEPERFLVAWQIYFGSAADKDLGERIAAARAELSGLLQADFLATFPELAGQRDAPAFVDTVLSTLRGIGMARLFGPQPDHVAAQLDQLARLIELRCGAAPLPSHRKTP